MRIKKYIPAIYVVFILILSFLAIMFSEEIAAVKHNTYWMIYQIIHPDPIPKTLEDVSSCVVSVRGDEWFLDTPLIYHAGGMIDGNTYTNSIEAIENSLLQNRNYIEIDLDYTRDGHLVCVHSWADVYLDAHVPTLEEFLASKIQGKYSPLSAKDLIDLMREHPNMHVITDVKVPETLDVVISDLVYHANNDANILDRVIIQLYSGLEKESILKIYPFKDEQFLFTLYNWGHFEPEVISICYQEGISVITAPYGQISDIEIATLRKLGYTVYEHTVNRVDQACDSISRGVSGFYTDSLCALDLVE